MGYYDYKPQVRVAYCKQCKRQTRQSRGNALALFTCRDPYHRNPTREQQEMGIKNCRQCDYCLLTATAQDSGAPWAKVTIAVVRNGRRGEETFDVCRYCQTHPILHLTETMLKNVLDGKTTPRREVCPECHGEGVVGAGGPGAHDCTHCKER